MCLAVPAQLVEIDAARPTRGVADVLGVRRKVQLDLLMDEPPRVGQWILIHVGFAMSRISEQQAEEQLRLLEKLGELQDARDELRGAG